MNDAHNSLVERLLKISTIQDIVDFFAFYQTAFTPGEKKIIKKDITFFLYSKEPKYIEYRMPKKQPGQYRIIETPVEKLKLAQKILNYSFQLCFTPREAAHGFVKDRSIVTNAKMHVGRKFVFTTDLENFFPSITFHRIKGAFQKHPFNFNKEVASALANICCNDSGRLPQGAPTSPVLSNLICRSLDRKLSQLAKAHKAKYSRYADDITFSCNMNIFTPEFKSELYKIIAEEHFQINYSKERIMPHIGRQMVNGLIVNKKLNVTTQYISDLRFILRLWEKQGRENAQAWLETKYPNRHRYNNHVPDIEDIVKGKIDFLKMVVGEHRDTYKKVNILFRSLLSGKKIDEGEAKKIRKDLEYIESEIKKCGTNKGLIILLMNYRETLIRLNIVSDQEEEINKNWLFFDKTTNEKDSKNLLKYVLKDDFSSQENVFPEKYLIRQYEDLASRKEKFDHTPKRTSQIFGLFGSGSAVGLQHFAHGAEVYLKNIIEEAEKDRKGILKDGKIPYEVLHLIESHTGLLASIAEKDQTVANSDISKLYDDKPELLNDFTTMIRIGEATGRLNLEKLIKYYLKNNSTIAEKYWYIDIDDALNSDLGSFRLSTVNLAFAFKKIVKMIGNNWNQNQRYSKLGGIKISLHNKLSQDAITLSIVDIKSNVDKTASDLMGRIKRGGDFNALTSICYGHFDLSVSAIFRGNQWSRLFLLPETSDISPLEEEPEGFTYELTFYLPDIKICLIDDNKERRQSKLTPAQFSNHPILSVKNEYDGEILNFDAIIVHDSIESFGKISTACRQYKKTLVVFGGSIYRDQESSEGLEIRINDEQMYNKLGSFIKKIKDDKKVDISLFKKDRNLGSMKNVNLETLMNELGTQIEKGEVQLPNIPPDIKSRLEEYLECPIPEFHKKDSLFTFIKRRIYL